MTSLRICLLCILGLAAVEAQEAQNWLSWPRERAEQIIKNSAERGRISGGRRLLNTERAHSYKLMATWLTQDVLQASTRLLQLRERLTDDDARKAFSDIYSTDVVIIMIEIDPDEGSGVIPLDWQALLQPKGQPQRAVVGTKRPEMRDIKAASVTVRNYDYDRFWVSFPKRTSSGVPLFAEGDREAELVVRIYDREGRVSLQIPGSGR